MKYTWEAKDIKGGRKLSRGKAAPPCILGYIVSEPSDSKYVLIDLRDGAVMQARTKTLMAMDLNAQGYMPESVEEIS